MSQTVDITHLLFEHVRSSPTKISKKVEDWLGQDFLREVILSDGVFWFVSASYVSMPNYVYDYIVKWGNSLGYTYLYDIPCPPHLQK